MLPAYCFLTPAAVVEGQVDLTQLRAIVTMNLKQALRPGKDPVTGSVGNPIRQIVLSMGAFGLLFAFNADRFADLPSYLIMLFASTFLIASLNIAPDPYDVRQRNLETFHSKAITQKTLLMARIVVLFIIVNFIAVSYALIPLTVSVFYLDCPVVLAVCALILLLIGCFSLVVYWLVVLMVAAQFIGLDRVRQMSQGLFLLVLLGIIGISFDFFGVNEHPFSQSPEKISLIDSVWAKFLPSTWFVDALVGDLSLAANTERMVMLATVCGAIGILWRLDTDGYFPRLIEKLSEPASQPTSSPLSVKLLNLYRLIPPVRRWVIPDHTFALASLVLTVTQREEISRIRTLVPRVFMLLFFLAGLSSFRPEARFFGLLMLSYYGFSSVIEGLDIIKQSSHASACWMLQVIPLGGKDILKGLRLTVMVKFFAFPAVLLLIMFYSFHPFLIATLLAIGFFIIARVLIPVLLIVQPTYPLSQDQRTAQSLTGFLIGMVVIFFAALGYGIITLLGSLLGYFGLAVAAGGLVALICVEYLLDLQAARRLQAVGVKD